MNRNMTLWWLVGVIVLIVSTILTFSIQERINAQKRDDAILDFESAKNESPNQSRKEKNKRFNHSGSALSKQKIRELPEGVENIPDITHWWVGMSSLPTDKADAVVVGAVTTREAHLSDDESNIYTEYGFVVEEVFKSLDGSISNNAAIALTRPGGSVRFKSGKIQKYSVRNYGVLQEGGRYLLFLKKENDADWFILTGYELTDKKVTPLDGHRKEDQKSELPFEKYRGADEAILVQDLETALKHSEQVGTE